MLTALAASQFSCASVELQAQTLVARRLTKKRDSVVAALSAVTLEAEIAKGKRARASTEARDAADAFAEILAFEKKEVGEWVSGC